jgi:hypothetical protein
MRFLCLVYHEAEKLAAVSQRQMVSLPQPDSTDEQ